jgi:uncharacterized protein
VNLSRRDARRLALAAQGFGRRPTGTPNLGHVRRCLTALGALQIDAVNVLVRSHYLPAFSRLGPYPRELLDRLTYQRRDAFEYWGHAASVLPVDLYPALRWRMARFAADKSWNALQARLEQERPGYLAAVEREVAERGPLAFSDLSDQARRDREQVQTKYAESSLLWYRWSDGKSVLDGLYNAGRLAVAGRRGFERLYDLAERVIPGKVLAAPAPAADDAQRELVRRAAAALGVAAVRDIADYFQLSMAVTKARVRELVEAGGLTPVQVEGWPEAGYLYGAGNGRPGHARALLSPFDSLTWQRERTQRLFGFKPSFELYVKPEKRQYGYYVLPFLLGDTLVGRVDLKTDRLKRALLVQGAFGEPGVPAKQVAGELAEELRALAGWLELEAVVVADNGDLAPALRKARP